MTPTLTYCTNLFPAESLEDVRSAIARCAPLRARLGVSSLQLGLHLSNAATEALEKPGALDEFAQSIASAGVAVSTLNAFPFGGFHAARVKEAVFRPTWEEPQRAAYTERACRILARLLPERATGAVSTHTGTFKEFGVSEESDDRIARAWLRTALMLARLEDETGRRVVLAVEPEPLSRLETTEEVVRFFERMWSGPLRRSAAEWSVNAGWLEAGARRHIGVCFDACHQAVEFEDGVASLARLRAAGIVVAKVQASSALALAEPSKNPQALAELARFAEPRWLHQTFARLHSGDVERRRDLGDALEDPDFLARAAEIRTHFHVPIFLESSGALATTRRELERVLAACVDASSVEVETYTLSALPDPPRDDAAIVEVMAREMEFAAAILGAR